MQMCEAGCTCGVNEMYEASCICGVNDRLEVWKSRPQSRVSRDFIAPGRFPRKRHFARIQQHNAEENTIPLPVCMTTCNNIVEQLLGDHVQFVSTYL